MYSFVRSRVVTLLDVISASRLNSPECHERAQVPSYHFICDTEREERYGSKSSTSIHLLYHIISGHSGSKHYFKSYLSMSRVSMSGQIIIAFRFLLLSERTLDPSIYSWKSRTRFVRFVLFTKRRLYPSKYLEARRERKRKVRGN